MDLRIQELAVRTREYWEKWLPGKTKELRNAGRFDAALQIFAVYSQAEISALIAKGCPKEDAERLVLSLYILRNPESQDYGKYGMLN